MSVIKVDAASHSYDVFVDEFTLDQLGEVCRDVSGGDACCIVSDSNVAPLYLPRAKASLEAAGYTVSSFVFEAGSRKRFRPMLRPSRLLRMRALRARRSSSL